MSSDHSTAPSPPATTESTDDPRSRIIETATRLFASRGYAATSIRDITQAAGVTNPTVYYHFGSKAGLFEAILRESVRTLDRRLEDSVASAADFRDVLIEFLAAHFETARDNPDLVRMYLECVMARREAAQLALDVDRFDASRIERLDGLLVVGQRCGALREGPLLPLRTMLAGMVLVPILQVLDGQLTEPARQTAESLVDLFLRGASPSPASTTLPPSTSTGPLGPVEP